MKVLVRNFISIGAGDQGFTFVFTFPLYLSLDTSSVNSYKLISSIRKLTSSSAYRKNQLD